MASTVEELIQQARALWRLYLGMGPQRGEREVELFRARVRGYIRQVFGRDSDELEHWDALVENTFNRVLTDRFALMDRAQRFLTAAEARLVEYSFNEAPPANVRPAVAPQGNEVFVIHGHDDINTLRLEKLLTSRFGVKVTILRDRPGGGRTMIEKFEQEAEAARFAFALLTPDDQVATAAGEYTQARPNVVFEIGWFYARLGRANVVLLLKRGTQIHSDLEGIERYEFDADVTEQAVKIQDELMRAGVVHLAKTHEAGANE